MTLVAPPSCVVLLQLHGHGTGRAREHGRAQMDKQSASGRGNLAATGGALTLCLSMISFAMHAGGPLSLNGVPI